MTNFFLKPTLFFFSSQEFLTIPITNFLKVFLWFDQRFKESKTRLHKQDMDAISSLRTGHGLSGFSSFSRENNSKSKLFPVMNLDLKEKHPMASRDFTNQTLTVFSSSSVAAPVSKKQKTSLFTFNLNLCGFIDS